MIQCAIHAENLTYRYGQLLAVDHINFEVGEGEILGFLGGILALLTQILQYLHCSTNCL